MNRVHFAAGILLAGCLGMAAQLPPGPGGPGARRFEGAGPIGMGLRLGKVVTGAPYSADVSTSISESLSDGNSINRSNTGHIARDNQGRTYLQQGISGTPWAQKGATTITFIADPVAGYTYLLNPNTKTAMRRPFKSHTGNRPNRFPENAAPPDAKERVETDLGQQVINGISATGKSITRTTPAGAIGNTQPIVATTEVWTSPDLQIVVLSKHTDPRLGQMTYSVNNIQRVQPNAALFQVPSDYTIKDAPALPPPPGS
jgi:hypothetical protein